MTISGDTKMVNHNKFYSKAYFYDLLFQFKDVKSENQALIHLYQKFFKARPTAFLDLAAGPGSNAIDMNKRNIQSIAIDYSKEMVAYGIEKAKEENAQVTYLHGDMRDFSLETPVDLAAIFTISTCYLLTNEDMIQHLKTVAKNLSPNGLYVLEMPHPRDLFAVGKLSWKNWEDDWEEKWEERWEEKWERIEGDTHVSLQWGDENDYFDPITQVRTVTARLKYHSPQESGELIDHCPQREYTFQEMKALIALSGVFELVDSLGDWDITVPFSNDKSAWRMILVLRKL